MGQEKIVENEQLSLSGEGRKIKIQREGEEKHPVQTGKKWTVVVLLITMIASLFFYFFSSGKVDFFSKNNSETKIEKMDGGGIFAPKVYEF
jgi:hypothetical protein